MVIERHSNRYQVAEEPIDEHLLAAFDADWYLSVNPDVADSGMDPQDHYVNHGRFEGRTPYRNIAVPLDFHLWTGQSSLMASRLRHLLSDTSANSYERDYAAWFLARWYAAYGEWRLAREVLFPDNQLLSQPRCAGLAHLALLVLAKSRREHRYHELWAQVESVIESDSGAPENLLAKAFIALVHRGSSRQWLRAMNSMWQRASLKPIKMKRSFSISPFDRLGIRGNRSIYLGGGKTPRVSIIVPVRNAASTINTAIRSIFSQSWPNIEVIIVDDASDDGTWVSIQKSCREAPAGMSVEIVRLSRHRGAYAARNEGVLKATGQYITVHDGDDWSHPQKISLQVSALEENKDACASISSWVRATDSLEFSQWRVEESGWIHPNVSSLMIRRRVIDELGFWDNVKVNADSEYIDRLKAAYGRDTIVHVIPDIPLSLGRSRGSSLSQHPDTHVVTQFGGARADYMASASYWHERCRQGLSEFFMEREPPKRSFPAPSALLPEQAPQNGLLTDERDRIIKSGLFDQQWYIKRYIELQATRVNAFEHYWSIGRFLGFDPGPIVSQSGYSNAQNIPLENALQHFIEHQQLSSKEVFPLVFEADYTSSHAPTILVCGHRAENELFGAERCLVDQVRALRQLGYNVLVVLPSAINGNYLHRIQALGCQVVVCPFGWWQQDADSEPVTVSYFEHLIHTHEAQAVVVNTIMLDEPLVAAKRADCLLLAYVHELPKFSPALCAAANASPRELIEHVGDVSDVLIANSEYTAVETRHFLDENSAQKVEVIPNTVAIDELMRVPVLQTNRRFSVSIIASGSINKGLEDLPKLCMALAEKKCAFELHLFVPDSPWLRRLKAQCEEMNDRIAVVIDGYTENLVEAFTETSVVLSLSRFQESFGRTALEAMAAARPFIGYQWGALPEVVEHGRTGWLVPFGDVEALAQTIASCAEDADKLKRIGCTGRARANEKYNWHSYVERTERVFSKWFPRLKQK